MGMIGKFFMWMGLAFLAWVAVVFSFWILIWMGFFLSKGVIWFYENFLYMVPFPGVV